MRKTGPSPKVVLTGYAPDTGVCAVEMFGGAEEAEMRLDCRVMLRLKECTGIVENGAGGSRRLWTASITGLKQIGNFK